MWSGVIADRVSDRSADIGRGGQEAKSALSMLAYAIGSAPGLELEPAPAAHTWMDQSFERHAQRFHGKTVGGRQAELHQTRRYLHPFRGPAPHGLPPKNE
jgi:hypothetical protein